MHSHESWQPEQRSESNHFAHRPEYEAPQHHSNNQASHQEQWHPSHQEQWHATNHQMERSGVLPRVEIASVADAGKTGLIDQALRLAGSTVNRANELAVNNIVEHESNWNSNAINLWDSNARAGHPSRGLMQTIQGTFNAFALPGYDRNITDPLSNLIAGIRYANSTYGSVQNVPGVLAVHSGRGYVGY